MFRFKQLIGDKIMAKKFERQFIEGAIKCFAINNYSSSLVTNPTFGAPACCKSTIA